MRKSSSKSINKPALRPLGDHFIAEMEGKTNLLVRRITARRISAHPVPVISCCLHCSQGKSELANLQPSERVYVLCGDGLFYLARIEIITSDNAPKGTARIHFLGWGKRFDWIGDVQNIYVARQEDAVDMMQPLASERSEKTKGKISKRQASEDQPLRAENGQEDGSATGDARKRKARSERFPSTLTYSPDFLSKPRTNYKRRKNSEQATGETEDAREDSQESVDVEEPVSDVHEETPPTAPVRRKQARYAQDFPVPDSAGSKCLHELLGATSEHGLLVPCARADADTASSDNESSKRKHQARSHTNTDSESNAAHDPGTGPDISGYTKRKRKRNQTTKGATAVPTSNDIWQEVIEYVVQAMTEQSGMNAEDDDGSPTQTLHALMEEPSQLPKNMQVRLCTIGRELLELAERFDYSKRRKRCTLSELTEAAETAGACGSNAQQWMLKHLQKCLNMKIIEENKLHRYSLGQ
jgi:hypothetical protein